MLISNYENVPEHQAAGIEALATGSPQARSGNDSDWVDPAGQLPATTDPGNTLGGWL